MRFTTFELHGWVKKRGAAKTDLNAGSDIVYFTVARADTGAKVIDISSPNAAITLSAGGKYSIVLAPASTSVAIFTVTDYTYVVRVYDAATGKTWAVNRGPLTMLANPGE